MKPNQIELICSKIVNNWDMYHIIANKSASVGHVCIINRVDTPNDILVIKIIKPLAIAQSCWEYKTLYDIFPQGTCEQGFIKKILESNGMELNVKNEINNINKGHEYYTTDYQSVFGTDLLIKFTTVQVRPHIIRDDCWFALAMTLAPGIPLSDLIENDLVKTDTKYRARLHRCLDLLVYEFFFNIIRHGFYHGDLHAGNIFFSYDRSQMTLIDFGAVGHMDMFNNDPDIHSLLDISMMALFYNYDEILDKMTVLLNNKCPETQIDPNMPEYLEFKKQLLTILLQMSSIWFGFIIGYVNFVRLYLVAISFERIGLIIWSVLRINGPELRSTYLEMNWKISSGVKGSSIKIFYHCYHQIL